MNIDNRVTSKYFSKNSMDESLSDFQEAKQSCKGPKTVQKQSKSKPKKTKKHIKGQKDIRTVLKAKKNELISYSKDFDNVCKQAGVDVDPEQLQLVIALSKSLQKEPESTEKSEPVSTQDRLGKIRTTLKEYGFKVPEIKITGNKRIKKRRKQYKLLLITEAERSQVISEKYSIILFDSTESRSLDDSKRNLILDAPLFHLSTNAVYECMRDNSIFYINNLVDKSAKIGSLLRDWSNIPGRPISPKLFEVNTMDFHEIDCSQNELDVILSSSIRSAQSIINSKDIRKANDSPDIIVDDDEVHEVKSDDGNDELNQSSQPRVINENPIQIDDVQDKETLTHYYRSCSPDLFDDEVSSILDNTKNTNIPSQEHKTRVFIEDVMELTECANTFSQNSNKPFQNVTKRKSNDYMEITECIVTSSQPILEIRDNIDLTQSPDKKETSMDSHKLGLKDKVLNNIVIESMDLTQPIEDIDITESPKECSFLNAEVNELDLETDKSPKLNIDLTQSSNDEDKKATELESNNDVSNPKLDAMDLTQSTNSSDDLPFVQLTDKLEDTIILDENDYLDNGRVRCSILPNPETTLDLTQDENESILKRDSGSMEENSKSCEQSFFEEFEHEHSESVENDLNESYMDQNNADLKDDANSDIDLTQDSDSSREINNSNSNSVTPLKFSHSFGNANDISTDYDEICNVTPKNNTSIVYDDDIAEIKDVDDNVNSNNDLNSSQNTEFEISDKELDYSLHQSRHDVPCNFEFGGISILDNVSNANHTNTREDSITINNRNDSVNGSLLPAVNVKNNNTCNISPGKSKNVVPIVTPNNGDYIVKTEEVTPLMDFAAMSTPQRNRELDKYGLKPFKRKRAIQLLTHLYNQTHPIVEPYSSEEQPSSSKKQKKEHPMSPKKLLQSPNKSTPRNKDSPKEKSAPRNEDSPKEKSAPRNEDSPKEKSAPRNEPFPKENIDIGSGNDVCAYEVTSDVPIVKSIECSTEEWVFQKREKAKVHSCRVPLHVSFHNYVSSRRELREAILKYEPVNIDVIHKELVGYGHRYDPQDLLIFLDKKCITVKTADNNKR